MKIDSISNQRGEVVLGVMVVVMVVMMLFGGMGMHMMHGDHRHADDGDRVEHKHDHKSEEAHQTQNCMEEDPAVHDEDTGSQK